MHDVMYEWEDCLDDAIKKKSWISKFQSNGIKSCSVLNTSISDVTARQKTNHEFIKSLLQRLT
jgi:hypothetical protein